MSSPKEKSPKGEKNELNDLMESLQTRFGEGAVMTLGDATHAKVEMIPSGSFSLDIALSGGLPKGRVIEIFGPESSGKTTLALHAVYEVQKRGGRAAFIDAEHALDPDYAAKIGVKIKDLIISQPDNGEEALNILESLVRSNIIDIIVVDSVAALTPKAEIEGEMGASHMGLQARLMSQALRKLTAIADKSNTIIIFINQIRQKIGIVWGNPETTTGGLALKFYASVRIDIRREAQIKKGDEVVGNRVKAKVVKNKVAPPFKIAEFDIMYGQGISYEGDVLNAALKYGAATKAGASYSFGEEKLGTGFDNVREKLKEDKKLLEALKKKTLEAIKEAEKNK
ncbi:MAG: recA protein [Candidatus Jorgensenbacteria bacterium GW2011_GWA1_48_11]|uniref:Protein RecA n=1 Tax=Candidatus Jorgensenbacteria bacterium GW2011_GWA1_48_11 TaxID=1618660 RepID=A0A0G1UBU1_9BACT|nr:MAG: recA protein [Candidatus Jorgensenbacteria bacterium GW2011_GWA1_48_11]KKW12113.1 MAG: recA protein [Candidatus Jorgensenbacteria bacterium GW2011_GWB1_49_9]